MGELIFCAGELFSRVGELIFCVGEFDCRREKNLNLKIYSYLYNKKDAFEEILDY